jgi:hypothetical protein
MYNTLLKYEQKDKRSKEKSGFLWNTVFDKKVNLETWHMHCHQGKYLGTTENEKDKSHVIGDTKSREMH